MSPLEITARLLVLARELGGAAKEAKKGQDRDALEIAAVGAARIALQLETDFGFRERARLLAGLSPRRATTGEDDEGSR